MSLSSPQMSSCSCSLEKAISHGCTPTMPVTHPVAPSIAATLITVSANSRGCASRPPYSFGCSILMAPDSRSRLADVSDRRMSLSPSAPSARISSAYCAMRS